ncbi:hypothetical protein FB567DRAFT_435542 [Paraphoma chrysanthemicola]|uniref:F-box domain-containing protein n=1 Tax=Paraphoma chrysanthemicola TaxID=798071 RepID=A0A8K0RCJ2_9PLEO|nr:hypothetical protein FB567DRAFT_435542 [Paraphoma chrysanthemicola]
MRRAANTRAMIVEVQNAKFASIYKLSEEDLLLVLSFLPVVADRLSFRLTSRRFASFVQRCNTAVPTAADKKVLGRRFDHDRYNKLVDAESNNISALKELLCSYCRPSHEIRFFSSDELIKSGRVRKCIGLTATFRFCEHTRITYETLLQHFAATPTSYTCTKGSCTVIRPHLPFICRTSRNELYYFNGIELLRHRSMPTLQLDDLVDLVKRYTAPMCLHMHTSYLDFQKRILSNSVRPLDSHQAYDPETQVYAKAGMVRSMQLDCLVEHCKTQVEIYKYRTIDVDDTDYIIMRVHRCLGTLDTPLNERWLAQIVDGGASFAH